jgi:FixJ family two-component response regulator
MSVAKCDELRGQDIRVRRRPGGRADTDETTLPAGTVAPIVLVVGEDAGVRHSLIMLFRSAGFHTCGFASALAFVRAAAWKCQRCCLVVDHQVPNGTDGLALLERLPALGASVPAIIINGSEHAGFRQRAITAGAVAVLAKPLLDDAILDAVADVIDAPGRGGGGDLAGC